MTLLIQQGDKMATLKELQQTDKGIFLAFDNGNSCCALALPGQPAIRIAEQLRELANMVMLLGVDKRDVN